MAEEDIQAPGGEPDDEDGEGGKKSRKRLDGKKRILLIVAFCLLLVLSALAAAYFTGALQPVMDMLLGSPEETEEVTVDSGTFYDLPEILVNLNTGGRKSTFLKIKVSIEVDNPEAIPQIEGVMPRVLDNFQIYLRELRLDDLRGSAGMYRLREELLLRVNAAVAPVQVRDVLFNEVLVQ